MNIAKHEFKGLFAILLLLLLTTVLLPISAFAAGSTTATITLENKLSGDTPPSAEDFAYTLTPDDVSYPMPDGTNGNAITIQGAGIASFGAITYSEPNTYTYTVRETPGNAENYTYDNTVYNVTVYVTTDDGGNLTAKIWVTKNGVDGKSANAVFTNSYKSPADSSVDSRSGSPADPDHPQTGDTTNLNLWVNLARVCTAALLILLVISKRKKILDILK